LERARQFDRSALGMLYRRFLPAVYRYVLARVGVVHTAEDITSETFSALVEGIGTMRAQDELTFAAWVLGIARNQVALHFRRHYAHPDIDPKTPRSLVEDEQPRSVADAGDPLVIVAARERWAEVVAGINRLSEDQRAVVLYRCVLGYSTEEVARLLDKQPNTVRQLQFRGLSALARYLSTSVGAASSEHVRDVAAPEQPGMQKGGGE
jgi:RNA polymerase sigma-70 factor (ECF subfamily)